MTTTKTWRPGLNHIEYWVADLNRSLPFFEKLFAILDWNRLSHTAFSTGELEIYFVAAPAERMPEIGAAALGPRHLCFQATSREMVDRVGEFLVAAGARVLRGPKEMPYSEGYYTVDFADPDGAILEVAHTPNMKM